MRLRNGRHGYGIVTKLLHWVTVTAIIAQFVVGWSMADDGAALKREKERIERFEDLGEQQAEHAGDAAREHFENSIDRLEDELDAREDSAYSAVFSGNLVEDGLSLPEVHVLLGLSIILLGLLRVMWRLVGGLPPWAEHLGPGERRLAAKLEKNLLAMLFVVPATGLLLIGAGDDWLPLHVTAQVLFLVVIAVHVGLVLRHTLVRRNRHLARML